MEKTLVTEMRPKKQIEEISLPVSLGFGFTNDHFDTYYKKLPKTEEKGVPIVHGLLHRSLFHEYNSTSNIFFAKGTCTQLVPRHPGLGL